MVKELVANCSVTFCTRKGKSMFALAGCFCILKLIDVSAVNATSIFINVHSLNQTIVSQFCVI
jgi:hypothetical protein